MDPRKRCETLCKLYGYMKVDFPGGCAPPINHREYLNKHTWLIDSCIIVLTIH